MLIYKGALSFDLFEKSLNATNPIDPAKTAKKNIIK